MIQPPFAVFDSDVHVDEDQDEIAACFEGAYANPRWTKISSVFPSLDGWSRSIMIDREDTEREHRRTDASIPCIRMRWPSILSESPSVTVAGPVMPPPREGGMGQECGYRS